MNLNNEIELEQKSFRLQQRIVKANKAEYNSNDDQDSS